MLHEECIYKEDHLQCSGEHCHSSQDCLFYTYQELYLPRLKKDQNISSFYVLRAALSSESEALSQPCPDVVPQKSKLHMHAAWTGLAVVQIGTRPWQAIFLKWRDQQGNVSSHINAFLVSSLEESSPLRA